MKNCLIVIDAQESFRHRPYFSERDVAAYLQAQNALIAGFVARSTPVVRVFHVDGPAERSNAFAIESGHVRPLTGLIDFEAAHTVYKRRHSALVGTDLEVWLTEQGVNAITISGIRTEQCCETTARHASDIGYALTFVPEATLTFDMQHLDGSALTASDIKARTAAVLTGRFARIATVAQVLEA
jgi:nicotinamidase-related amidase